MDIYKQKFTKLQQEIMRLLFMKVGVTFNQRALSKRLKVSPTAIAKSIKPLEKEKLITVKKNKESKTINISINTENPLTFGLKRAENLKLLYESGIVGFLEEKFPGAVIILFGSYSYGEDTINSDIDIAVIGAKQKEIDLRKFEKLLEREIRINFYPNLKEIHKNLKENLCNGILLKGGIEL